MFRYLFFWLFLLCVIPLAYPVMVGPGLMQRSIYSDYQNTLRTFQDKAAIDSELVSLYKNNLAWIGRFAHEFKASHDDSPYFRESGDKIGVAIADIPHNWADSVNLQAYSLALRVIALKLWGLWLCGPVFAGICAGLFERKLKMDTFSAPAPPLYNTSVHLLIAACFSFLLWLLCPIPFPIDLLPAVFSFLSYVLYLAIANLPNYH
jgi:hypothetical protein